MLDMLFESRQRAARDAKEVRLLRDRYGDTLVQELKGRARDRSLPTRDRKHWQRILRKARRA